MCFDYTIKYFESIKDYFYFYCALKEDNCLLEKLNLKQTLCCYVSA